MDELEEPAFAVESAYTFDSQLELKLIVNDRSLWGQSDKFLRIDLYPRARPTTKGRHFGFWDIPLNVINAVTHDLLLDTKAGTLRDVNTGKPYAGWRSRFTESGLAVLHLSLWHSIGNESNMAMSRSYPLLIACPPLDTPLKQVHIPVTARCNLECTMCRRTIEPSHNTVDMSEDVFSALLAELPAVPCAMIMSQGEPLLYPGILDVVHRCRQALMTNGELGMTTNATLLDETISRGLLERGLDFLYCSVDGATKTTYEAIRVGANFDTLCQNIERFSRLRQDYGSNCRLMLNFVMQEQNIDEVSVFLELALRLGAENVTLSYVHGLPSDELNSFGGDEMKEALTLARKKAAACGINLSAPRVMRTNTERCLCTERVLTSADGGVYPCPQLQPAYNAMGQVKCFGNLRHHSLRDIWNSDSYRAFRRAVVSGDFPEECTNCGFKAYLTP